MKVRKIVIVGGLWCIGKDFSMGLELQKYRKLV